MTASLPAFPLLGAFTYVVIYTVWLKPRSPLHHLRRVEELAAGEHRQAMGQALADLEAGDLLRARQGIEELLEAQR